MTGTLLDANVLIALRWQRRNPEHRPDQAPPAGKHPVLV